MDVIGDTQEALSAYPEFVAGLGKVPSGILYLHVYGVLQALVLQQDAVENLSEALAVPTRRADWPELSWIRDIRISSAGHTTKDKRGEKTRYHFITRWSLSHGGFELMSQTGDGESETKFVVIGDLLSTQEASLSQLLAEVKATLLEREREHYKRFSDQRLAHLFNGDSYAVEKISAGARGNAAERAMAKGGISVVKRILVDFQAALEERGSTLDTYGFIRHDYEVLAFPVEELENHFESDGPCIDERTAYIYGSFISERLKSLKSIASEIDDTYMKGARS